MALHADSVRPRAKQGEAKWKDWKHMKTSEKIQNEPQNGHMRRTCAAHGIVLCRHYALLCYAMAVLICSGIFRLVF